MKPWTRRSLLIGGAVVALPVVAFGAARMWCHIAFGATSSNRAMLIRLAPTSDSTRTLGKQYLQQTGSTALASLRRLESHGPIAQAVEAGCPYSLASAVEQISRDDFRQGRVHCIDGWVLAESELDLAVLSTIS